MLWLGNWALLVKRVVVITHRENNSLAVNIERYKKAKIKGDNR